MSSEASLFWKLLAVQHFTTRSHEQACFSVGIEIESAVFGCNVAEQRDVTVLMDSAEKHNAHAPYFTGKSRVRSNFFPVSAPKENCSQLNLRSIPSRFVRLRCFAWRRMKTRLTKRLEIVPELNLERKQIKPA